MRRTIYPTINHGWASALVRSCLTLVLGWQAAAPARARDVPGFGTVSFPNSCAPPVQADFETAIARLHDFDGPEDAFLAVAAADPHCAAAW